MKRSFVFVLESNFYKNELLEMRENYKKKPLKDIKINRPDWLKSYDPMSQIFLHKSMILQEGKIVYAKIVQANTLLFRRFPAYDCAAELLYSTHPYLSENPEALYEIAAKIYSYKGQDPRLIPEEWKEVARVITDERDRTDFTFSVGIEGCDMECHMIPTIIFRKLLPKGKLIGNILPVLVAPGCKQVILLPKQYWSKNFKKAWIDGTI